MSNEELKNDIDEILTRLLDENVTSINLLYRLAHTAITFAWRGQIEESKIVWQYASTLNSAGRRDFRRRIEQNDIFNGYERVSKK